MLRRWVLLACCTVALSPPAALAEPAAAAADVTSVAASVPAQAPDGAYDWPLAGWPRVARPFQPPVSQYGPGHRGVDLATGAGAPVLAAAEGTVVFAGDLAGRGVVSMQHPDGLRTTYEPVTPQVQAGTAVARGQPLGVVQPGHPECASAACLHWGVRRGQEYLDPLRLIGRWPVRLKPWAP